MAGSIEKQLSRVRRRERLIRLCWGFARWLALILTAMALACLVDWLVDLRRDTPMVFRVALLLGQVVLWCWAAKELLLRPMFRRMADDDLALWVESKAPSFEHRLISAVQLTRPRAATRGMSHELISAIHQQAEAQTSRLDFTQFLDRTRLRRGAWITAGILAACVFLLAWHPELVITLVARQFLTDRQIPRSVSMVSISPEVWPAGEAVALTFQVSGEGVGEESVGELRIEPVGKKAETYPLTWEGTDADGRAIFIARNIHSATDFSYRAWLNDGRTRQDSRVLFEARPVVDRQEAWVQLPAYAGLRPDGSPYEQYQPRGEASGLIGTTVRIQARVQKEITQGTVEVLGRPGPRILTHLLTNGLDVPASPLAVLGRELVHQAVNEARVQTPGLTAAAQSVGPELVLRSLAIDPGEDKRTVHAFFDLRAEETGYRIRVRDRHGFANLDPPRRGLRVIADEPPHVALLPERFAVPGESLVSDDTEVEGLPVPLGHDGQSLGSVRIAYTCRDPFGIDRARLRYRVNEEEWRYLPLQEIRGSPEAGPFDSRQGAFENSGQRDQIEFHAVPSSDPEQVPARLDAGGRFDFLVRAIPGLKLGDQVEFAVEVFDRHPDPNRKAGESEIRRKEVVSEEEFVARVLQTLQQEARIRQLEQKQRGVFERPARKGG